jgi:hypothetical protein
MSAAAATPAKPQDASKKTPGRPKGPAKEKDPNISVIRLRLNKDVMEKLQGMASEDDRSVENMAIVLLKRAVADHESRSLELA